MKMEMGGPENVEKGKNVGGGYCSRDFPPEDDCCAICFDDFNFPSKTSCGHWFCCKYLYLCFVFLSLIHQTG